MSTTHLVKGQRLKLTNLTSSQRIQVKLNVAGLQRQVGFYAIVINADKQLLDPQYLIHVGQPTSPNEAISLQHPGMYHTAFNIDLDKLPEGARGIDFVLSIGEDTETLVETASEMREGNFIVTDGNVEVARYSFTADDFDGEKALVIGKIYHKSVWRLAMVSSGFRAGMRALLPHYGIPESAYQPPVPARGEGGSPPPPSLGDGAGPALAKVVLPADWPGNQPPTVPGSLTSAVGLLLIELNDGNRASGTGFVINPGGYMLTCHHVIEGAKSVNVCMDGTNYLRPAIVVASSPDHDAALIWLADGNGSPHWLSLTDPADEPQLGNELGLLGYPLGLDLGLSVSYSQGIINSLRRNNDRPLLQIDAGAASGSSGGPVFRREDGRVVGILQGGFERHGMLINLAWDIRAFWTLDWHATL